MNWKQSGALTGAVTLLALGATTVPGYLVEQWVDSGLQAGLIPMVGTPGTTASMYTSLVHVVEVGVPVLLGVGLGYTLARRLDDDELSGALRGVVGGSIVAVLLAATVPLSILSLGGGVGGTAGVVMYATVVLQHLITVSLLVTAGTGAGVVLDRYDLTAGDGVGPIDAEADTEPLSDNAATGVDEEQRTDPAH
jgi:hypothetical protein